MSYSQTSSSSTEASREPVVGADPEGLETGTGGLEARARLKNLLRRFGSVRLELSCDLGQANMKLRSLLALKRGSVVAVDRPVGEDLGLRLNGLLLGKADVMVVDSRVLLRITEIRHDD